MSSTLYNLVVDDTSPIITFIPPPLGPNPDGSPSNQQAQGWITQFDGVYLTSLGMTGLGNSTSTHLTSLDGATFQLNFVGTGITLLGSTKQSTYDIVLDGLTTPGLSPSQSSPGILYSAHGLSSTTHSLTLVVHGSDDDTSFVSFDKAIVEAKANSTQSSALFIPDTSLSFVGSWAFQQIDPSSPLFSNTSILSYHQSTTAGDTLSFTFPTTSPNPVSISVLGILGFLNGLYNVTLSDELDNTFTRTYNGSFDWVCGSELFIASTIPETDNNITLTITNIQNKPLSIAGLNVTQTQRRPSGTSSTTSTSATSSVTSAPDQSRSLKSSLPVGTVVALVLSSIAVLLLLLLGVFIFLLRQRRRQRRHQEIIQPNHGHPDPADHLDSPVATEKSKSSSSESVLDIGRPASRTRTRSSSGGDRFTPLNPLRRSGRLSLPRTAMSVSDRNGGGGQTPAAGFSQPYANYTYPGPVLRAANQSPFIFSFDTSSNSKSHSPPGSPSNADSSTRGRLESGRSRRSNNRSDSSTNDDRALRERTSAMTKLTGDAKSTFLDLDYSRPQTRDDGQAPPPDVPTAVASMRDEDDFEASSRSGSGSGDGDSSRLEIAMLGTKRHSPPRIFLPPPISPPPTHPPPPEPTSILQGQGRSTSQSPITLHSSDLASNRSSSLHPYVYGYAYQPSVSGASGGEDSSRRESGRSEDPPAVPPKASSSGHTGLGGNDPSTELNTDDTHQNTIRAHPYAQATAAISEHQTSPRSSYVTNEPTPSTPYSGNAEVDMVFARPTTAEVQERRKPPGIEFGEVRPDDPPL